MRTKNCRCFGRSEDPLLPSLGHNSGLLDSKPHDDPDPQRSQALMTLHPVELAREPGHLLIKWSDGELRRYRLKALQDACPCANCREKRSAPPPDPFVLNVVSSPQEVAPLEIVKMAPIGRYAYSIKFNHGCTRGIYSFETLRSLGEKVEQPS